MSPIIEKSLSMPMAAKILLVASLGALLFALIMQYGLALQPCVLCLWQRVPYIAASILLVGTLLWKPFGRQSGFLLGLCALSYLSGMGLAIFHSGVELHWWLGTSGCAVTPLNQGSIEDIRRSLLQTITPRCDQIAWTFLGLSMTNYNIVFSFILEFFATLACLYQFSKKSH
jgi:disulfide bond formation protein DsbB